MSRAIHVSCISIYKSKIEKWTTKNMEVSKIHCKFSRNIHFLQQFTALIFTFFFVIPLIQSLDYSQALSKSLLYFEAQRSGRLPYNQRAIWRHHSGLTDGLDQGVRPIYCISALLLIFQCKKIKIDFSLICMIGGFGGRLL